MFVNIPTITNQYTLIPPIEHWRPITELVVPGVKNYYLVSTYGRLKSLWKGNHNPDKLLQVSIKENDYLKVNLAVNGGYTNEYVHRLVLATFNYIDGCELLDVNHKDGIKSHNWIWNLEWLTRKENIEHGFRTGIIGVGEDANGSLLDNQTVESICCLLDSGVPMRNISEITGVSFNTIFEIYRGNTWFSISINHSFLQKQIAKVFSNEDIDIIISNINTPSIDILRLLVNVETLSEPKRRIYCNLITKIQLDLMMK